jgi:glycosyltransferase involved in cell wall biosynthesis
MDMARIGKAPQRAEYYRRQIPRVTMFMITHIPNTAGYYKDHIRITELSMNSMITHAAKEGRYFDFLVWDNGSSHEWQARLMNMYLDGYISRVVFSDNVGKCSAMKHGLSMIQSEIVAYSDDDVLFYPDWLNKQLTLLDSIPKVASVSGSPVASLFNHFKIQRKRYGTGYKLVTSTYNEENLLNDQWIEDDAICRGLTPELYMSVHGEDEQVMVKDSISELEWWDHGHHMQFTGNREVLLKAMPDCENRLMGRMREWNTQVQSGGYKQITTIDRTCRHMGNVLDNTIVQEAIQMGLVI